MAEVPVRRVPLHPPSLEEIASAVRNGLQSNFSSSSASISVPPDLRQAPFYLASPGLSGKPRVADIGGQMNLFPSPNLEKQYDLFKISDLMEMQSGVLIGAGAGPFSDLGLNTELMPNIAIGPIASTEREVRNHTRYAKVLDNGSALCEKIGTSTGCALMCNLFGCEGDKGPLLYVKAKGRTGNLNFTGAIQKGLADVYGDRLVSLGGVFIVCSAKVKMHIMPDFAEKPFKSPGEVQQWLRFFDMDAQDVPLVCLSVLHSGDDGDLGLRKEHTHCFGVDDSNQRGGHYHFDLDETMDTVEYEGWFNVAEILYKID